MKKSSNRFSDPIYVPPNEGTRELHRQRRRVALAFMDAERGDYTLGIAMGIFTPDAADTVAEIRKRIKGQQSEE